MLKQNDCSVLKTAFILIALMAIMVFTRVYPLYDSVITDWPGVFGNYINFAADDAVYHMRLVQNTVAHFPVRILYDPFTNFPFGSHIHFGPLFTLIIAFVALIAGLGHPSVQLVNYVGAYVPVFMGALCLLPVYFIAKKLFGREAALLTAVIFALLPGEFLARSSLGYADHHVAEVLFSTTTLAFLIFALHNINAVRIWNKKTFYRNIILAGIFNGLYFLIWPGAVLFTAIFLIYLITQSLVDYYHQQPTNYLFQTASAIFLIPIILLSPYAIINPRLEYLSSVKLCYSLTMPLLLLLIWGIFAIIYYIGRFLAAHKFSFKIYPLTLIFFVVLIGLSLHLIFPKMFSLMFGGIKVLFAPSKYMRTVMEDWPILIDRATNKFSLHTVSQNFYFALPLAILGLLQLIYLTIKKRKPTEILFLVTSIVIMLSMFEQQRFAYYFTVYVAILAGLFCYTIIADLIKHSSQDKLVQITLLAFGLLLSFFIIFPITPLAPFSNIFSSLGTQARLGAGLSYEWYETLLWLRTHTPDPQGKVISKDFDYANGIYKEPKQFGGEFDYPKSAYSIMSWWDYGHDITYVAARIPVANPFQEGIIQDDGISGAAPFFTAIYEDLAVKNLNKLKSRYVLINNAMATRQFFLMALWAKDEGGWTTQQDIKFIRDDKKPTKTIVDSDKIKKSMTYRLYYLDADQLQHFRLVYESSGDYQVDAVLIMPKTHQLKNISFPINDLKEVQKIAANATTPFGYPVRTPNVNKKTFTMNYLYVPRPPAKSIKIFEKVNGATIVGRANNGEKVNLKLNLISNARRPFSYSQTTKAINGEYKFVVPYATEKMRGDGYDYNVIATSPYLITVKGRIIASVNVSEKNITNGDTLRTQVFR